MEVLRSYLALILLRAAEQGFESRPCNAFLHTSARDVRAGGWRWVGGRDSTVLSEWPLCSKAEDGVLATGGSWVPGEVRCTHKKQLALD